jgi:hypothetical protein
MRKLISGAAVLAFSAALALPITAANAATYVSNLEYKNTDPTLAVSPIFGTVTLTETSSNSVDVLVHLISPQVGFLNTGSGDNKAPFTFSLTGDYDVATFNPLAGQQFADGGFGSFQNNNFGIYTNKIDCCGGVTGGAAYDPTDLHFVVTNTAPGGTLTFAGVGATFAPDGRLLTEGTGPRFLSTVAIAHVGGPDGHPAQPGGFWFAADVITNTGATFDVAARDAFRDPTPPGIPEPASWALMIVGFGGVGAMIRRQRTNAFA